MCNQFQPWLLATLLLLLPAASQASYVPQNDLVSGSTPNERSNSLLTVTVSPSIDFFIDDAALEPAGRGPYIDATPTSVSDFLAINGDVTIDVIFSVPARNPAFNISGMDNSLLDFGESISLYSVSSNFGGGTAAIVGGDTLEVIGPGWDGSVIVKGTHTSLTLRLTGETTQLGLGFAILEVPEPSSFLLTGATLLTLIGRAGRCRRFEAMLRQS